MKHLIHAAILALGSLALPAASLAQEPAEHLPLAVHGDSGQHDFRVEVADQPAERSRGLMGREHLAADAGMLFLYPDVQAGGSGFWMYRTLIPLDIAFIDEAGRIVSTHTMQPCGSGDPADCAVTRPGVSYRAALEVNAGTFESRDIEVGNCVTWPGAESRCD